MNTESRRMVVGGLSVDLIRKDIKNLHLGVYPPDGRIRVAVPLRVSDNAVRLAVVSKLSWIKRQRASFVKQPRQSAREMVSGESHYYLGRRYRLRVIERELRPSIRIRSRTFIELGARNGTSSARREQILLRWYREQLRQLIPPLVEKWQRVLGVSVAGFRIRRMKTKWGSCNAESRTLLINLELAKKPPRCIEYIVAHEAMHLLERRHNERFRALLTRHFPDWKKIRAELNEISLSHEEWGSPSSGNSN